MTPDGEVLRTAAANGCSTGKGTHMTDHEEIANRQETAYDVVKDDVLRILGTLRVRLLHISDGSVLGDKCWGFFLGEIREASYVWHAVRERKAEVARLDGVIDRLRTKIQTACNQSRLEDCKEILKNALEYEVKEFARAQEVVGRKYRLWPGDPT